jgi:hypothetical protein
MHTRLLENKPYTAEDLQRSTVYEHSVMYVCVLSHEGISLTTQLSVSVQI